MIEKLCVAIVCGGLLGCGGGGGGDVEPVRGTGSTNESLGGVQAKVFDKSCATVGCHRGSSAAGGLTLEAGKARASLVDVAAAIAPAKKLVVPGQPAESFLMAKLHGQLSEDEGLPMPYGKSSLSADDVALVEQWIRSGAKAE